MMEDQITQTHESGILAVDIGGGTQDILLWRKGQLLENAFKMVMPSATVLVAEQIRRCTSARQPVCLTGYTMGGGANHEALSQHIKAGFTAYALPEAALTLHDNLDYVKKMGVLIVPEPPTGVPQVFLQDLDMERLRVAFAAFEVELPRAVAVAVQDHGFSPWESNRITRLLYWKQLLDRGGWLRDWVRPETPSFMTRMLAVKRSYAPALVLDTGVAAILGALQDEQGKQWQPGGMTVVNIGNFHTVAALVKDERVYGIYEHHTGLLSVEKLARHLRAFCKGRLGHEEIFAEHGHGCVYAKDFRADGGDFSRVLVTGPKRRLLSRPEYHQAAPYGDMMLSGCFGLLLAASWAQSVAVE